LRLLAVHAHPDDEASKGAALVRRYVDEGIGATLVCCTGGEVGDIVNPAMDRPEVRADLAAIRREELARSAEIIGFDRVDMLGYRDSGMPEMEANADPTNFWNAPLDEATGRLVRIIRRDRPQVILTYGDDQGGYPHPDHLRTHDISVLAFERAGDSAWYPEAGEVWESSKLYYFMWSLAKVTANHQALLERGLESPFDDEWRARFNQDHRITTKVFVGDWWAARDGALLAHATQIDPTSVFWFGLPADASSTVYPFDECILAASNIATNLPEDDLFAGLR